MIQFVFALSMFLCFSGSSVLAAGDIPTYTVIIKDHKFEPAEFEIPVNQKVRLIIDNQDSTKEEFESDGLNREKLVGPNKQIEVYIGPLNKGSYKFFGEYHPETAKGIITVQ